MVEILIELFLGVLGVSIAMAIFGFLRNPQIPAMLAFAGMFIFFLAIITDSIIWNNEVSQVQTIPQNVTITTDELVPNYSYFVESRTGSVSAFNTNTTRTHVEFASTGASLLVGDTITCMDMYLGKTLSPTGIASMGVFYSNATMKYLFGTQDVALLTSASDWHTYCLTGSDTYTFINGDRIGLKYSGGDASNTVTINVNANNPFDGVITYRQVYNNGTGTWTSSTSNDITMRLYNYVNATQIGQFVAPTDYYTNEPTRFEFTELPKILFALIGVTMMLCGGIMVGRNQ